jgi:bifunctional pyridoxal-dependent enzyme with beta-cystathionase and maltose regulon repressor activities
MKEMANIVANHEHKLISNEVKVPIIYFKENQYTVTQALKNSNAQGSIKNNFF